VEGATHAATGFVLGTGIGLLTHAGVAHGDLGAWAGIGHDVMYGVVTAGLALMPDSDHPQASFAHAAGVLSHGLSHIIAVMFGGHRQGMHSIFGVGLVSFGMLACTRLWPNHWSLGVMAAVLAICIAAGLGAIGFARHGLEAVTFGAILSALAVVAIRSDLWWLTALGMALHIFEDEFSGHGCALLWPFTRRRFGGDGRQPSRSRSRDRRPVDGRRSQSRRPADSRPRRPARDRDDREPDRPASRRDDDRPRARRGPQVMCPHCWVGECGACKTKCGCPLGDHPARKTAAGPASPAPAPYPETPPF
jgi:membrane-bound metal-dependent hydrolase YbcI (DUF457 family)